MSKNIIITGATGNLGSAVMNKLLKEGNNVAAIVSHGRFLTERPNLSSYQADLTKEIESNSAVENIIADFKIVHGVVLTVGGFAMGGITETSIDEVQRMITLNFTTAYNIVRPVMHHFRGNGSGRIILIGSRPALESDRARNSIAYSISKSMLIKLSEIINAEENSNIKATVIIPDIIDTPTNRKDMPSADFSKWISPAEIAETIYEVITFKRINPTIKLY